MEILPDMIPCAKKGYMLQEMDGEMLLYSPTEVTTTYMNPSAVLIWKFCDGRHSVQTIVDDLTEYFPDALGLSQDVISTLEDFYTRKLVEFR